MPAPLRGALPQRLVDQARTYASGEQAPAQPRDAATVVLLRAASRRGDAEVYLLRRQTSMEFAGGMCVFPGGGVDPRDFEESVAWAGPPPEQWSRWLSCEESLARALVCAAVRETFEESGVLLAGASASEVVADTTGEEWEVDRAALESRELSLTELLRRRDLVLRTDLLRPYAAWTTPVFEPKRFATWFFVASLPAGQRTRDVSRESDAVMWLSAADAVARVDAGQVRMMPPTYLACLDVARAGAPDSVLAAASERVVEMFTPEVVPDGERFTLSVHPQFVGLLP